MKGTVVQAWRNGRQGQSRTQGEFEQGCISWTMATNSGEVRGTISNFQAINCITSETQHCENQGKVSRVRHHSLSAQFLTIKVNCQHTSPYFSLTRVPCKTHTKLSEPGEAGCFVTRSWINQEVVLLSFFLRGKVLTRDNCAFSVAQFSL